MNRNAKSSITLPPAELRLVRDLKARLRLKSNVEVVRRGLQMLVASTERRALKEAYRRASQGARGATLTEIAALDHLVGEGVD